MTKTESLRHLFESKIAKIIPILLIILMIGAASSTIYVYYIVNNTATVQYTNVLLAAGPDASGSCSTTYPCATVTVGSTKDFATVTLSLFPSNTNSPQPATYYSNLLQIQNNGTVAHSIKAIQISGFAGVANLGNITVDYCTAQSEFNPSGTLVTPASLGATYSITSSSSGTQSMSGTFPISLAASGTGYFEIVAYALGTANSGSTITFQISIQWL